MLGLRGSGGFKPFESTTFENTPASPASSPRHHGNISPSYKKQTTRHMPPPTHTAPQHHAQTSHPCTTTHHHAIAPPHHIAPPPHHDHIAPPLGIRSQSGSLRGAINQVRLCAPIMGQDQLHMSDRNTCRFVRS
mmetsp:Transcript_17737/g.42227  ORF Transcript_17737/g.42227 Transcript_17737/m.42227 type:complete len:134 (-) Transcript_17737:62-463(-)